MPYGRGDDIWPPTNQEFRFDLSDSLVNPMQGPTQPSKLESRRSKALLVSIWISSLTKANDVSYLPLDALVLVALSGYFLLLHRLEVLPRPSSNDISMMPLYKEPLGPTLGRQVETWNTVGIFIGIVLPYLCLFLPTDTQSILIRPLLLYCAQTFTETVCREHAALPIRAMVPMVYTAVRLSYWIYLVMDMGPTALAVANICFAAVQLVLVLPYLALRYMRIHCFLIEAKSVELRSEASIGLTPR